MNMNYATLNGSKYTVRQTDTHLVAMMTKNKKNINTLSKRTCHTTTKVPVSDSGDGDDDDDDDDVTYAT